MYIYIYVYVNNFILVPDLDYSVISGMPVAVDQTFPTTQQAALIAELFTQCSLSQCCRHWLGRHRVLWTVLIWVMCTYTTAQSPFAPPMCGVFNYHTREREHQFN